MLICFGTDPVWLARTIPKQGPHLLLQVVTAGKARYHPPLAVRHHKSRREQIDQDHTALVKM
jgi:hypothetical protein